MRCIPHNRQRRERMSELSGFVTTKVINSHVKLRVKSDAQKVNWNNE